jgi:hypothetical protein
MTPQEKANAGLWLLKQAVLDYLATRPNGTAPSMEVREALRLHDEDHKGENKGRLLWGLANLLNADGSVRSETIDRVSYMILAKTEQGS